MNNTTLKIILLIAMLILTLIAGLTPIKVVKFLKNKQRQSLLNNNTRKNIASLIISLLTCFAGGVFLAIIFLDLLPDANEALDYVQQHNKWNIDYPIVQLFALIGFFFVYFIEEISVALFGEHSHGHDQTLVTQNPTIFDTNRVNPETKTTNIQRPRTKTGDSCEIHGFDRDSTDGITNEEKRRAYIKSFTFTLALIIHSSLEGFAFGIQSTEVSALSLFFGIIVHKCVVAFSVGMRLMKCHPNNVLFVVLLTVIIAVSSPIFGIIGTIIEDSNWDELSKNEVSFILIAISMGTFLYIAFFEMLAPERLNEKASFFNMLATFSGFAIIAGIMTVAG